VTDTLFTGERAACLEMRKQFCAYTNGMQGGAAVREQAVHAATVADYRRILEANTREQLTDTVENTPVENRP
jgi:hypothetical protein